MPTLRSTVFFALALLIGSAAASGQLSQPLPTPQPSVDPVEASRIRSHEYIDGFKNLTADETKRFTLFDKNGGEKKTRLIHSSLFVYQSADETAPPGEFRNIIDVDGKKVDDADRRAASFFEKVLKATSASKELEKIREESTRHDLGIALSGFTLNQAVAFWDELRPVMKFTIVGEADVDGHPAIEISYQQTADSANISVNSDDGLPNSPHTQRYDIDLAGKRAVTPRLSGKLWVDATTFQLRRERRTLSLRTENSPEKIVVEQEFDFQDSEFGILTPKRVSHLQYRMDGKTGVATRDAQVVFEYGKFSKPDVEVTSSDVKKD